MTPNIKWFKYVLAFINELLICYYHDQSEITYLMANTSRNEIKIRRDLNEYIIYHLQTDSCSFKYLLGELKITKVCFY